MKKPPDLAKRFLEMANRDLKAFQLLVDAKEISDESIGFHAQQAVEKYLKSILALHRIELRKTHDFVDEIGSLDRQQAKVIVTSTQQWATEMIRKYPQ